MSGATATLPADDLDRLRQTVIGHFAEHPYDQVGIRGICDEARVSTKTVYKYFGSKEDLLLACIEPDLQALADRAESAVDAAATPIDALFALGAAQFAFYAEHPEVARIVFLNLPSTHWVDKAAPGQVAFQALLERTLRDAHTRGALALPDGASWDLARDVVSGAAHRVIVRWLVEGRRTDLVALGRSFAQVIARALAVEPAVAAGHT